MSGQETKAERLARQLRENLKRRKAQARGREGAGAAEGQDQAEDQDQRPEAPPARSGAVEKGDPLG